MESPAPGLGFDAGLITFTFVASFYHRKRLSGQTRFDICSQLDLCRGAGPGGTAWCHQRRRCIGSGRCRIRGDSAAHRVARHAQVSARTPGRRLRALPVRQRRCRPCAPSRATSAQQIKCSSRSVGPARVTDLASRRRTQPTPSASSNSVAETYNSLAQHQSGPPMDSLGGNSTLLLRQFNVLNTIASGLRPGARTDCSWSFFVTGPCGTG